MTDKQLRSISKTNLLSLVHQQELEIERLAAENAKLEEQKFSLENAGSIAEASMIVSGIIEAAQSAADVYLDSIRKVEAKNLDTVAKQEDEAKLRALRTIERQNAETLAHIERLVSDILKTFDNQVSSMAAMKEDLTTLLNKNNLQHLLAGGTRIKSS